MNLSRRSFLIFAFSGLSVVFLILRFSGLLAFPIFNDEAIYVQYTQLITEDFNKLKYISIDNVFHDWKPPLQYWLGTLTINWSFNPLWGLRFLSAIFWLLGAVGIYFLASALWEKKEGFWAVLFYALNPSVFFYGGQFIAEVYVWTAAIWLLASLAILMKRSASVWRPVWLVGGLVAAGALLLFKQAGFLYFYLAWLWPLFFWPFAGAVNRDKKATAALSAERRLWRRNAFTAWVLLVLGWIVYKLAIPAQLFDLEKQFTGRWTLNLGEIFSWPATIWSANLNLVWDFFLHYYSPAVLGLAAVFTLLAFWRRQRGEILISVMFWLASLAVVFGLRGFNEYLYHTAVIVFLATLLGRGTANLLSWRLVAGGKKFLVGLGWAAVVFILIFWVLQIYLLKGNPAAYLDRGTDWLRGNNLLSWANGFNMPALIEILRQQPEPTVAFVDPQWGNPGTALQVFQNYYPQVRVAPITGDLFQSDFWNQLQAAEFQSRLAIFSQQGNAPEMRQQWQSGIEANFCGRRFDLRTHPEQTPVTVCLF